MINGSPTDHFDALVGFDPLTNELKWKELGLQACQMYSQSQSTLNQNPNGYTLITKTDNALNTNEDLFKLYEDEIIVTAKGIYLAMTTIHLETELTDPNLNIGACFIKNTVAQSVMSAAKVDAINSRSLNITQLIPLKKLDHISVITKQLGTPGAVSTQENQSNFILIKIA